MPWMECSVQGICIIEKIIHSIPAAFPIISYSFSCFIPFFFSNPQKSVNKK